MNHLFKRFRRDIIGLFWLATAVFLGLALISYFPKDPSFSSASTDVTVQNYCGYFGSFISDFLYQVLGLTSWILVIGALRISYFTFMGREIIGLKTRILWGVLLFLTTSSLTALYFPETKFFSDSVYAGGMLGLLITKALTAGFNFWGVAVILWTMTAMLLVFYTEKTLKDLFKTPIFLVGNLFQPSSWTTVRESVVKTVAVLLNSMKSLFAPLKLLKPAFAGRVGRAAPSSDHLQKIEEKKFYPLSNSDDHEEEDEEEYEFEELEGFDEEEEEPARPQMSLFSKKQKKKKVSLKRKIQRRVANWELPGIELLEDPPLGSNKVDEAEIKRKSDLLMNKLEQFSVRGRVVGAKPGPAITMFEFKPDIDVKISKITDLADDLSLALSSESVRIIAPIPGRDVVGIETSNSSRETVFLKEIIAEDNFWDEDIKLPLAVGTEADGSKKIVDLRKMPHLMVAGSTGSGKSVFVVSMITGLLFRHSPETLKLILIDPKQVDLAVFNNVPHLVMPPIRDTKKAVCALRWAIKEMDKRYRSMAKFGARGIDAFNNIVEDLPKSEIEKHEDWHENLEGAARLEDYYYTPQPYVVIVVEEFGDLMAVDKANVESSIVRLAQMARACGIHLILAMQSPRKDVVTGLIKTNIPGRISFKVASKMDSRIILDESGGERLLTRGDMLFLAPGVSKPERHHGPWLSDEEIARVTECWKEQGEPDYDVIAMRALEGSGGGYDLGDFGSDGGDEEEYDEKYDEILSFVSTQKTVSASMLQRRFRLGYPRAARMIEVFESEGVVGPANGSKPRQVLVSELK